MPSPLNKSEHTPANDGGDKGKDQEWWAAEQAKWKADMQGGPNERTGTNETPQKDDIDAAQRSRRELLPQFDASVAGDQDSKKVIRLRTYTISKQYASEALGVQFYTPEQGPGVRITAMNEAGPFGRCGDLEDDDVLVEINGHPVLYAGHAGVIACIKEALHSSNQMSITVCRPVELNKLEDLKQTTKVEEQIKSKTGPWSKFKKKLGGIITPKPAGRIKVRRLFLLQVLHRATSIGVCVCRSLRAGEEVFRELSCTCTAGKQRQENSGRCRSVSLLLLTDTFCFVFGGVCVLCCLAARRVRLRGGQNRQRRGTVTRSPNAAMRRTGAP